MARDPKKLIAVAITAATLMVGLVFAWLLYFEYHANPWTRDAHVRANIIEIAPRVEGPIVDLPVVDNQQVRRGQLLFQIDPTDYENAVVIAKPSATQPDEDGELEIRSRDYVFRQNSTNLCKPAEVLAEHNFISSMMQQTAYSAQR